jgi:hypothetical protein
VEAVPVNQRQQALGSPGKMECAQKQKRAPLIIAK